MNGLGKIILVGAGPGDAGLLTLRGKKAIEEAQVVLFDRLAGDGIIAMIPDNAVKVDVGKKQGRHPVPQNEINNLLVKYAKEGKRVVRLKGGDPYLFGRGGEELEAALLEDIPFEVVPGITSAIAVPAYAGIPVSHRDFSSSVHIITAHKKSGVKSRLDYESLVRLNGTLLFLMGLSSLEAVTAGLLGAGMSPEAPAALIENGTRPNQRKLVSTVGEILRRAKDEGFSPPSVFVVGGVCSLSDKLDWFSRLPLKGVRVVVTRPKAQSELSQGLKALGALVMDFPCIETSPLKLSDRLFTGLGEYGWIVFTSPVGAKIFFEAMMAGDIDIRSLYGVKFAAVGPKTAAEVTARGIKVDYMPHEYNGKALGAGLPLDAGDDAKVLLFRAESGAKELAKTLEARGFAVNDVAAYETVIENECPESIREALLNGKADFVTFTSASTVLGFTASLPALDCSKITAVCIGEETAGEARGRGFKVIVSEKATIESMIECIEREKSK